MAQAVLHSQKTQPPQVKLPPPKQVNLKTEKKFYQAGFAASSLLIIPNILSLFFAKIQVFKPNHVQKFLQIRPIEF